MEYVVPCKKGKIDYKYLNVNYEGIAEFERDLIVERTALRRVAAKGRGVKFGRPSKLQPNKKPFSARQVR